MIKRSEESAAAAATVKLQIPGIVPQRRIRMQKRSECTPRQMHYYFDFDFWVRLATPAIPRFPFVASACACCTSFQLLVLPQFPWNPSRKPYVFASAENGPLLIVSQPQSSL